MQQEDQPSSVRNELLERLRALEGPQSSGTLAELAYRRAREALERALEEARVIRLQAIDNAKATRERELTALMESIRSLRQSAETQIESLLLAAEIESNRLRGQGKMDAQASLERATNEAALVRAEAAAVRASAEERAREVERIEAEFNQLAARIAERLGMTARPDGGWLRRLRGGR